MGYLLIPLRILLVMVLGFWCASAEMKREVAQVKLQLAREAIHSAKFLYPNCQPETTSVVAQKERFLAHLNVATSLLGEAEIECKTCLNPEPQIKVGYSVSDCLDIFNNGQNKSGVYRVYPRGTGGDGIKIYCDMDTEGGGWTVLQRRGSFDKQEDFQVGWKEYKDGFGDLNGEFWIGNENIFSLTHQGLYQLRYDLTDAKGVKRYALYDTFWIENEKANYKLHVEKYSGDAGDAMAQSNLAMFSTKDRNNDRSGTDCFKVRASGFWFHNCCKGNPNGLLQPGKNNDPKSVYWWYWKGWECLSATEIKIRRY